MSVAVTQPTTSPWLVVGLGNPGDKYAETRHNIGHMVANTLRNEYNEKFQVHKAQAVTAEFRLGIGGPKIILAKLASYMNLSGKPVAALMKFYKIGPENLVVIHDELDIDFDAIRLKRGGGEGGHNGLKAISQAIGTRDYFRVRAGIGRPQGRINAADYVLQRFSSTEKKILPMYLDTLADATQALITDGLTTAQNRFH